MSSGGEEQRYTRAEMEAIFGRRQHEHRQLLEDAAELLNPRLERIAEQIAAANHVKEQLRAELEELTAAVKLSQVRLEQHVRLPSHAVGARMISSLGLETMSEEERAIFPAAMRAAVDARRQVATQATNWRKRTDVQMVVATAIGALAGLLLFGVGLIGYMADKRMFP